MPKPRKSFTSYEPDKRSSFSKVLKCGQILVAIIVLPILLPIAIVWDYLIISLCSMIHITGFFGYLVISFGFAFCVFIYRHITGSRNCVRIRLILNGTRYILLPPAFNHGRRTVYGFSIAFELPCGFILLLFSWFLLWRVYKSRILHELLSLD